MKALRDSWALLVVIAIGVFVFCWWFSANVYPTNYFYTSAGDSVVRVDRATGQVEQVIGGRWVKFQQVPTRK